MALSRDRNTERRDLTTISVNVKAATLIFAGALVARDSSGWAVPGATATGLVALGRAEARADNSDGSNGDITVEIRRGVFRFGNSADTDEIAAASIGDACYIVDDETVAKTDGTGTRSPAGIVVDVDASGVWVEIGVGGPAAAPGGALLAANNLNDVTAATARANIGANKYTLTLRADDLVAANAAVYGAVAPVAGTITKIWSVLEADELAAGNATLTGKIGAVAITNGVVTITQSGSAIGDVDSATPSAAHAVTAGQWINFTVGGGNTDAVARATITVEITF